MARKYKLTGCAKFFIFFIIAAPLAWIGASYYNGQNPIEQVKEFIQSIGNSDGESDTAVYSENESSGNTKDESVYQEMELKDLEIKTLKNDLKDCETLNDKKDELIETQKKEITHLKQQLQGGTE